MFRSSVRFDPIPNVHRPAAFGMVYEQASPSHSLPLLQYFEEARDVRLSLVYPSIMHNNYKLLVEAVNMPPAIEILFLRLLTEGHTFGPCVFHLLRMSPGIRELKLQLADHIKDGKVRCSSGCTCYKPQNWETTNIRLKFLLKVEINNFNGAECQIFFVKRLLRWTPVPKTITLSFDPSVTVSEEVCEELLNFATPGICMEIYLHRDGARVKYTAVN